MFFKNANKCGCVANKLPGTSLRSKLFASKRAADPNQMFIYIGAIVIVAFVFIFGVKAVLTINKNVNDIDLAKFVRDFQSKAASVSTDFGRVQFVTLSIPSKFARVCLVNTLTKAAPADSSTCPREHGNLTQEVCDTWKELYDDAHTGVDRTLAPINVFFIDDSNKIGYKDYVPDMSVVAPGTDPNRGWICTKDGKLRLEGEARIAKVSLARPN